MHTLARVSAFAIIGLFLLNVALGIIEGVVSHRVIEGEALGTGASRSSGRGSRLVEVDIGEALTADVRFFGDRVLIDVESTRVLRTQKELRFGLLVTPRAVEGSAILPMDRLAVDGTKTAIVTEDGSWFHVKAVHGVGLIIDGGIRRSSPVYAIGVARQVELVFPAPSLSRRATLLVRWAPGRSTVYAQNWRVDRVVQVNLPPGP
jgi:hypothetical protein